MSLEIRELSIKVSVNQNVEKTGEEENTSLSSQSVSSGPNGDTSVIVAACVEQVIEVLKDKFKDW